MTGNQEQFEIKFGLIRWFWYWPEKFSSCNIGEGGIALAEAVLGSAPDIAGKNLANPTALLLSSVTMLRHIDLHDKADRIQNAILNTIAEGKYRTADLGGTSKTTEFTKEEYDCLNLVDKASTCTIRKGCKWTYSQPECTSYTIGLWWNL